LFDDFYVYLRMKKFKQLKDYGLGNQSILNLYFYKFYLALIKRLPLQKQKTYEAWAAKGYNNTPEISFIIQSHNKSLGVISVVKHLRNYPNAEIIVIDDGSDLHHTKQLTRFLHNANEFLIRANDLYEIVMYDKAIRFANGSYVVLLQDDDNILSVDWVYKGLEYLIQYPDMVILGGRDGLRFKMDEKLQTGDACAYPDGENNLDEFRFVHVVNRAPVFLNKALFTEHLKHIDFSFAPFQSDDSELCLRAWLRGLKVGWYKAGFKSLLAGGMRIYNNKLTERQVTHNGHKLYDIYNNSIEIINKKVEEANQGKFKQ
jgi:glycosyltransferase involved in cell wall biosynthesis